MINYDKLSELMNTNRSFLQRVEQYETLLFEIKQTQLLRKKKKKKQSLSAHQYRHLKRYDILKIPFGSHSEMAFKNEHKLVGCLQFSR